MDEIDDGVALSLLAQLEGAREVVVHGDREPLDLLVREVRRRLERREACAEEDLVRVRASDPRDCALVAEEGMQLPALAAQDLAQRRRVERERVGPEVRQILLELLLA